jgi:predicted SnoaL-like aldol condensation-catalyzing enzyme
MKENRMNNKERAISFLRLASSGNVREAYETYVHPQFRHHNPYVPGDRASLLAAMEENAVTFPQKEFEAVRALEDGDLVAVHGRVRLTPSRPWIALIHIFRFQDNQIIEEWEVGQEVPKGSPNEHGVF